MTFFTYFFSFFQLFSLEYDQMIKKITHKIVKKRASENENMEVLVKINFMFQFLICICWTFVQESFFSHSHSFITYNILWWDWNVMWPSANRCDFLLLYNHFFSMSSSSLLCSFQFHFPFQIQIKLSFQIIFN